MKNDLIINQLEHILEQDESTTYDYSCAMVNIKGQIKNKIKEWINNNIDKNIVYWGPENDLGIELDTHITVMYGYDSISHAEIFKSFNKYPKKDIKIKLGEIKVFSHEEYDVLHIRVISKDLMLLNSISLNSGLKIINLYDKYIPHITLAYIKKNSNIIKYLDTNEFINNTEELFLNNINITTKDGKKQNFYLN